MSTAQSWWEPDSKAPEAFESEKINPDDLPTTANEDLPTRRIHLLGTGSIGTLVASALIQLPNPPPVTLLIHKDESYRQFQRAGRTVRLINKVTDVTDEQTGYDVDLLSSEDDKLYWKHIPHQSADRVAVNQIADVEKMDNGEIFIYNLIVTVKGPATQQALTSIRHRVNAKTTILLMQNGLGQIDELNQKVFTDPATRPTYMIGVISHGCHMAGAFAVIHAGAGTVALGVHRDTDKFPLPPKGSDATSTELHEPSKRKMFPTDADLYSNISARYLLRTMTRCPSLACAAYPYLDLFQLQLEKLVSNCIINPATALLDMKNGRTLKNPPLLRMQRLLVAEISLVIQGLPELEGIPNVRLRFDPSRLEKKVRSVTMQTAQNSSSMREDIRNMKLTEIDYLNGYIVKRGEEQGIQCVLNYMMMQLIKAKYRVMEKDEDQLKSAPYGRQEIKTEQDPQSEGAIVLEDISGPRG